MAADAAEDKIAALLALQPQKVDLSLARIKRLLAVLGNPQQHLPPIIHIAGTNGKGSAAAFCRAYLEAAGYSCHVHSSPHLVHWRERYRLGRKENGRVSSGFVSDTELAEVLEQITAANADAPITVFEILTAAAFVLFARHPADQAFLGDTISKIAAEKAAIIKPNCPAVIGCQPEAAAEAVLCQAAEAARAKLSLYGRDYQTAETEAGWQFCRRNHAPLTLPMPALTGRFQTVNAAAAYAAVEAAGFTVSPAAAAQAMGKVYWPARLQRLTKGRLLTKIPPQAQLWLDGGHNPAAAAVLAAALPACIQNRPFYLICAMLENKDSARWLQALKPLRPHIIAIPLPGEGHQGRLPAELARLATGQGLPANEAANIAAALTQVKAETAAAAAPFILIGGSLYLAGAALAENGTAPA